MKHFRLNSAFVTGVLFWLVTFRCEVQNPLVSYKFVFIVCVVRICGYMEVTAIFPCNLDGNAGLYRPRSLKSSTFNQRRLLAHVGSW